MQTQLNKVIAALQDFYAQERFLLERDLGERTLTHRLAVYVERQFAGWQTDCNYDRLGERTLRLPRGSTVSSDDHLGKSIYPDIVVHQRDIPNNLLAIELRKDSNHQPIEHDQHKLQALTDPHVWFAYEIGVLVIVGRNGVTSSEVYVGGAIEPVTSIWFAERLRVSELAGKRDDDVRR
ncbi:MULTISPECIES: hypothetical protein [unclassified Bradyrhizobium]|uniref:hypothetical protein n=1 Tax=unclassified Bradyrhizobium TaxID=2631580 RepID=UPI002479A8FC|nr:MULTISPECIES: hypothetical protein [unclassified Bradyrhizobium]WGR93758.1 hypothetical protein MTX20_04460 [Bradyrhizobium sp. ISRA435]WGR98351.1 hypothetical protein MTX23_29500 [Bradyrhizobium sp. ISRA436]WGS05239.1 hypothetical protein MTX18_29515 [Bradyrhizobium sp. ISRA437]WGS12125.1 hypothetical protein MTX26_29510 [Bradyrhizobium sp. ISRA443]WGS19547.1 hypothetical protein MTX22_35095 [Bradyrhizobium sp. ISRA463]